MVGAMGLSYQWRTVLKKLAEYGDEGIDQDTFCDLMGDGDSLVRNDPCKATLLQMLFTCVGYYEVVPPTPSKLIRITEAGREALGDE